MTQPSFGARIGSYEVEGAFITRLEERLATYVKTIALRRDIDAGDLYDGIGPRNGKLPIRPRHIVRRQTFFGWPENDLPFVQVVASDGSPEQGDEGLYRLTWTVNVFCVVSGRDHEATRLLRSIYEDAIPWAIMQGRTLGGFASALYWIGDASDDVPLNNDRTRTLQGSVSVFSVVVDGCLDPHAGPAVFFPDDGTDPDEYAEDVVVEEVEPDYAPIDE
jgi:hypothetical protein